MFHFLKAFFFMEIKKLVKPQLARESGTTFLVSTDSIFISLNIINFTNIKEGSYP